MKPGDKVASRYVIEKLLGQGGMGAVYVAKDEKFGVRIALKVAQAEGGKFGEFKDRFVREAKVGNRLGKSAGFVRAFDWGELPGSSLYLAMDLVEGARSLDLKSGTLRDRIARLRRAAHLVAVAHQNGVIHRDLKPANFLQGGNGSIWLADFGLAKFSGEVVAQQGVDNTLTMAGVGMGTPAFMPPEQFDSLKTVDERADVYALGAMLFFALTQHMPFEGALTQVIAQQTLASVGREAMPSAKKIDSTVPDELDALCARAIALEKEERLESAKALVQGLDAYLASQGAGQPRPAAVGPRGSDEDEGEESAPNARMALLVGGPLAVLLILGAVLVLHGGKAPPPPPEPPAVAEAPPPSLPALAPTAPAPPVAPPPSAPAVAVAPPPPNVVAPPPPPPAPAAPSTATPAIDPPTPQPAPPAPAPEAPAPPPADLPAPPPVMAPAPPPPAAPPPSAASLEPASLPKGLRSGIIKSIGSKSFKTYTWRLPAGGDMVLVYVPRGDFLMGNDGRGLASPRHAHPMPKGYWIGMYDVTWGQFLAFCKAKGRHAPDEPLWEEVKSDLVKHPIVGITWDEAEEFCAWAKLALPTEAEWEKAARGTEGRNYPWGNDMPADPRGWLNYADKSVPDNAKNAHGKLVKEYRDEACDDGFPHTSPVGACPNGVSPYGALDMAGNVLQWCEDEFEAGAHKRYANRDFSPQKCTADTMERPARGGAWCSSHKDCQTFLRQRFAQDVRNHCLGFRVVLRAE